MADGVEFAASLLYNRPEARVLTVQYRGTEFEVKDLGASRWRWTIYSKKEIGLKVIDDRMFITRAAAVAACQREIDKGLTENDMPSGPEGERNPPR